MSVSTTYLLNVALHAAILSVFASLVLLVLRQARHRSVAAIAGLLAIGFLPWLTALRPVRPVAAPVPEIQTPSPVLPTWTLMTLPARSEIPTPAEATVAPEKFVYPDPLTSLTTLWAAGAGIGLLLLGTASLRVRSWRKSLRPLDDTTWQSLQAISPQVPDRHHFLLSETTASPCVTGLFRPRIVLPRFLLESASEEEMRWAVRHEIAHWQASDSRWMILFACIRCVDWWNPLVHRLVSQWADAREQLCDLHATGISDSRADYGEFLIAMARKITNPPALTIAMAKRPHAVRLRERIVSLLGASAGSANPVGKGFVGVSSAVFIGCAILVSVLRIGAEEPVKDAGIAAESEPVGKETEVGFTDEQTASPLAPEDSPASLPEKPSPQAVIGKPVSQLKFTNKLVMTAAKPTTKDGALLTDDEVQAWLRALSQTKGVDLMTSPSVTAKFGQTATVEIIREVLGTRKQIAARNPKSPAPFIGIRLEFNADLLDNQVNLKFDPEYHFIPGLDLSWVGTSSKAPPGTNPDKIKIAKRAVIARLSAGQTLCTDLGEIEPGKFLQIFTHVQPIDATGRALDNFKGGLPSTIEADPVPGFRPLPKEDPADFPQEPPVKRPLKKS